MRTLHWALAAVLLAACGCRSNTGQHLVEQESRMFEDEVYRLEAQLDECCRAKEALAHENEDLRKQLSGNGGGSGDSYRPPAGAPPRQSRPRSETPKLEAPTIEIPGESSDTPPDTLPGNTPGTPGDQQPGPVGAAPAKISINKRLTGGLDRDNTGGDEGVMVVIEPRDAAGKLTNAPGAVSVVVMDPAQSGEATRVARWDFQANEVAGRFKKTMFGEGLQFELPWPSEPPKNRDLQLFVRYITDDGTKLNADAPIHIRMASDSRAEEDRVTADSDAKPTRKSPSSRLKGRTTTRPARQARGGAPEWSPNR